MPSLPADRSRAAVEDHSSIRPARRQPGPSWRGWSDCIKQEPAATEERAEQGAAVGRRRKWGRSSMWIGRKASHRAAKLVLAGSMLALAASLAGAQQPQAPAPAPAAPA